MRRSRVQVHEGDGTVTISWQVDPGCGGVTPVAVITEPRFTG